MVRSLVLISLVNLIPELNGMSSVKTILLLVLITASVSCSHFSHEEINVQPAEFAKLAYEPGAQVLDVRTIGEFRSGHLKGAMQADWLNQIQFEERTSYLEKDHPLYVYCMSGTRGTEAAKYLQEKGFTDVRNLEGGLIAWKSSGKKLVECKPHGSETPTATYEKIISSASQVIVGFNAAWSPPCKKMQPVLSEFGNTHAADVKVISMDGGTEASLMHQLHVSALPTYILYRDGREFARKHGVLSPTELEEWIAIHASEETPADSQNRLGQVAKKRVSRN